MAVILFLLILSFLVIIHELGHFITALWTKVEIEEFGIGYPPRAITLFRWRKIPFTLNWLPFGGFVRMAGEDGPSSTKSKSIKSTSEKSGAKSEIGPFYTKKKRARLLVLLAGVTVNFLFGLLAFSIIYAKTGIPALVTSDMDLAPFQQISSVTLAGKNYRGSSSELQSIVALYKDQVRITSITPESPAAGSGLPENVNLLSIKDGEMTIPVASVEDVLEFIGERKGQTVTLVTSGVCDGIDCPEMSNEYQVYVRTDEETPPQAGNVGISFAKVISVFYPWWQMPVRGTWLGIQQSIGLSLLILQAFGDIFVKIFTQRQVPQEVAGPVGIVDQARRTGLFEQGWVAILNFSALLSINLAILNLLPIPALDGGRAVFVLAESVIGAKRREWLENRLNAIGFVFLIGLIVLITAKDIWTLFH